MNTTRRIYRNTREGKIGGVAAGLGDYLAVDPVIIRLAFLLLVLAGGFGLLAYLVAWIVIPAGDPESTPLPSQGGRRRDGRLVLGIVLAAAGAIFIVGWPAFDWGHDGAWLWPLLLVGAGALLIVWRRNRQDPDPGEPGPGGESGPPVEPPGGPDQGDSPTVALERPVDSPTADASSGAGGPLDAAPGDTAVYPLVSPSRIQQRRLPVGWITLGAILAAAAVSALLDVLGAIEVPVEEFLLVALGLTGIGVVAGALVGRVRGPLALGAATGVALLAVAIVDVPVHGGVGERTVRPAASGALEPEYRLGAGDLVLDLRSVDLAAGSRRVEASVGLGSLVVLVPAGVAVVAEGTASVGEVDLFGQQEDGVRVQTSAVEEPLAGSQFPQPGRLYLDLAVGVGRVEARLDGGLYPAATRRAPAAVRSDRPLRTVRSARG